MAAKGGISGSIVKDAAVIAQTRKWSVAIVGEAQSSSSTATSKGVLRVKGPADWNASYDADGHTPAVKPGEGFTFHGSIDGVNGGSGACLCAGVSIQWAHEQGQIVRHSVQLAGNGAWTWAAEAGAADSAVPTPYPSLVLPIKVTPIETGSPVEATLGEIRSGNLNLNSALSAYASTTTAGWKKRVRGPWDGDINVTCYVDDPATIPEIGKMYTIKLYVTDTLFWQVNYGLCVDVSGIDVDVETGAIVGASVKFAFSGIGMAGAAPGVATLGSIAAPGAASWWPES